MTPPDDAPGSVLAGAAPLVRPEIAATDPQWYKDAII